MEATRNSEETLQPTRPRWLDWVEKNSQPKSYFFPRPKRALTPWQKRGPMTRRDWVRFYQWAAKKAVARPELPPPPLPEPPADRKGKGKKKRKQSLDEIMEYIKALCEPRHPREKYVYPPPPTFPYAPKLHPKKPPRKDRGRPFPTPKVPARFYHIEHEIDFWSSIRFPPVRAALKYKATPYIISLAKPKKKRPEKPKEKAPRRCRMSYRQWLGHKRRLEYLAKPIIRPPLKPHCTLPTLKLGILSTKYHGRWQEHQRRLRALSTPIERPPSRKHCPIPQVFPKRQPMSKEKWSSVQSRLASLSQPIVRPPKKKHCPVPEPVSPRRPMSPQQWSRHQQRLEKLSTPIYRPYTHDRSEDNKSRDTSPRRQRSPRSGSSPRRGG